MSKKKQQYNGFFFFMLDMQRDLREQGRMWKMKDMPLIAGPKWSKLSDAQKQAYNQRAKREKQEASLQGMNGAHSIPSVPPPRPGKMDCMGELLSERRDLVAELEERRRREREALKASFPHGRAVSLETFYFLDFQSLCEIPERENDRFMPCEMAVAKYSLNSGIQKTMHKFIDPGPIPMGYRFLAKSTSETTHEIPIEGFDTAERDYRQIVYELHQFLNPEGYGEMPIVFAKRDHAERVEWSLQWLADKAGSVNMITRVYEVEGLFCELYAHLGEAAVLTFYQTQEYLKTSVYDHEAGTRCGWHEQRENRFCSLGTVNVYCYVLSDNLCAKYGIALTKNHLPEKVSSPACTVVAPSRRVSGPGRGARARWPVSPSPIPPGSSHALSVDPQFAAMRLQETDRHQPTAPSRPAPIVSGRGRGRGRGFMIGAGGVRQPRNVGGLQQRQQQSNSLDGRD